MFLRILKRGLGNLAILICARLVTMFAGEKLPAMLQATPKRSALKRPRDSDIGFGVSSHRRATLSVSGEPRVLARVQPQQAFCHRQAFCHQQMMPPQQQQYWPPAPQQQRQLNNLFDRVLSAGDREVTALMLMRLAVDSLADEEVIQLLGRSKVDVTASCASAAAAAVAAASRSAEQASDWQQLLSEQRLSVLPRPQRYSSSHSASRIK